jgi:hypothetical protein
VKKWIGAILCISLLVGCSSESKEPVNKEVKEEADQNVNKPTQEELNAQLKKDAVEYDYLSLFRDEVEKGSKVKFTGEVFAIMKEEPFGEFGLQTLLDDGTEGVLSVTSLQTEDTPVQVEEGETYTIYGVYGGKDENGAPNINATIVEQLK